MYSGPENGVFFKTDKVRVQQCLINLITNAIKFSPKKSKVVISIEQLKAGNAVIKVAD